VKHLLSLAALLCGTAHAEFFSGQQLLDQLQAPGMDRLVGIGYVAGIHDLTLGAAQCTPPTVTLGQLVESIRKVLVDMPQVRDRPADQVVIAVLKTTWPCKKGTLL